MIRGPGFIISARNRTGMRRALENPSCKMEHPHVRIRRIQWFANFRTFSISYLCTWARVNRRFLQLSGTHLFSPSSFSKRNELMLSFQETKVHWQDRDGIGTRVANMVLWKSIPPSDVWVVILFPVFPIAVLSSWSPFSHINAVMQR